MDKLPVGQLPDLQQSNNDDEIMVITNSEYSQLKKEKISDLITDFTSTNENNALTKGTDGKMFVTDFGNASNITDGTLPVSVLPDIPKDLLPAIETSDLPLSGVTADTYAYPSSVTVNAQGQVTAIEEGTPSGANANTDLSNITEAGKEVIRENAGAGLEICDIGIALYVDETKGLRRYLNGQIVDVNTNTQAFLNRLLQIQTTNPDYFTDEDTWQAEALLNIDGCVYKFVLNYADDGETVVSVRLPKYPDYVEINSINSTAPVSVYGSGMTLGLTNGNQDNLGLFNWSDSSLSAVTQRGTLPVSRSSSQVYSNAGLGVTTDPVKSGLVGTANLSTSQTKLKMRYFIQIATGQETQADITNEIELNNPFFFGMYQYFEAEPNNLSWLKSAGQWNSKAVYPDYYNWLLQEKNNPSTLPASANVEITGSLINNNGVLSGFGESNYAEIPQAPSDIESLELVFKFTTGDDITTRQSVYGQTITNIACPQCIISGSEANMSLLEVLLGLDAGTWGEPIFSLSVAGANTTYTTKVTWDNASKNMVFSLKTEDGDFIQQGTVTQNTVYWTEPMRIGADKKSYPWLGSIDLNGCYININGSRWWSGMTNGVKFSTEDYSDYDYVINTSDETFRLPLLDGSEDLPSDNLIHVSGNLTISSPEPVSVYTAPKNCYITLRTFGMTLVNSAVVGFISGNVVYTQTFGSLTNQNSDVIFMQRNQTLILKIDSANSTTPTVSYNLNVRAAQGNGSLYYYTGETVQNASLINAGRIAETKANKTEIDGVWAGSYSVIFTGVSFTAGQSRTYSLSEYLPNDGNIYEVLFIGRVTTGATAGDTARLNLTTSVIPTSYPFVAAQTPAARAMYVIGSVLMPVGVDRNIKVTNTSAGDTATFELAVSAYRKVR